MGSIPDEVFENFHWLISSHCNMTLGSTQSLTEMSTRDFPSGIKALCSVCVLYKVVQI
jgi:hypothetical protein